MLDQVDLSLTLSTPARKQILRFGRQRLFQLVKEVYDRKVPVIVVFEGWDAAGKGTNIRRLTRRLDPRGFKVIPTQAPRTHEKKMPWLWRFWMKIPRRGQMAIFDRSWYGRVLVERVEGLTPIPDWIRAYEEINQFERTLADDGTIFVKFWLHISKREQLRRFINLTQNPEHAWQVTAEDWEHHRKYDEYLAAVRDMLANTHTPYAPWEVVPATDSNYTTYHIFRTVIQRLEEALDMPPTAWPSLAEIEAETIRLREEKRAQKLARREAKKEEKRRRKLAEQAQADEAEALAPEEAAPETGIQPVHPTPEEAAQDGADQPEQPVPATGEAREGSTGEEAEGA